MRPLCLQPSVPPGVLLDYGPTLQAHSFELGLWWLQHARLEIRVLFCGTCGAMVSFQEIVTHGVEVFALNSLMNFSLRLVCMSPSMRLKNPPIVMLAWDCDSSILRSLNPRLQTELAQRLCLRQKL